VTTLYIVGFALAAVGVALWLAKRLGLADARKDAAEKGNENARKALEIEERNRALPDPDVDRRLFGDRK
jgi:hypothetical protein